MNSDQGAELLLKGVKGFHGKFKKMYGQMALRLDDDRYIVTGDNKLLAGIVENDLLVCDINTGDLGKLMGIMPEVNAFIFGCSQDLVEASNSEEGLPIAIDDIAQIAGTSVEIIENTDPIKMANALRNGSICLVKGIGGVSVGSNMKKAVAAIQILAKSCEAYVHGKMIGGVKPLPESAIKSLRADFMQNYVQTNEGDSVPFIGFDEETFALRTSIIETGKDLVRSDLVYGSWGNVSVKIDEHKMLITPSSMDYFEIGIEDIVEVDIDTLQYGQQRVPSTEVALHARMYREIPDCNAIIHTHSNAISVFAACEAGFAMPDPKMQQIIGDVRVVPYAPAGTEELAQNIVATMKGTHAAILSHHGAIFYGPSPEVVFKIAEAVELMARKLLAFDARPEEDDEEKQ